MRTATAAIAVAVAVAVSPAPVEAPGVVGPPSGSTPEAAIQADVAKKKKSNRKPKKPKDGRLVYAGVVSVYVEDNVPAGHAKLIRQAGKMLGGVIPVKFVVTRTDKSARLPQIAAGMRCDENTEHGSWGLAWGEWNRVSYACDIPTEHNIRQVMFHELAHAVGVPHSEAPGSLMSAVSGWERVDEVGQADIDWIRAHWDGYPGKVYRWTTTVLR